MTPSEIAAVLERMNGIIPGLMIDEHNALCEAAAIIERLGDDALVEKVWDEANFFGGRTMDAYRRRVLEGEKP